MNHYEKFANLKRLTDRIGIVYGTEDFAVYLYSLVKMTRPKTVLELGTGLGSTALWAALALEENSHGIIHTIDNGSEWHTMRGIASILGEFYRKDYTDYMNNLISHFELHNQINFINDTISDAYVNEIDILFCDYSHGPHAVTKLIADYLLKMTSNSFIFIDSASTYYPSFQLLESMIFQLNSGKIPLTLRVMVGEDKLELFQDKVMGTKFELTHLIENKNRNQNSTTQIKLSPVDIMPQPRVNIRF
jgi:tRNA A58 N-methylase Trm61